MKHARAALSAAFLFFAAGQAQAQAVAMARETPYAQDADIQRKVREECTQLPGQLPRFTQAAARAAGVEITLADAVSGADGGRVLELEIVEAVSLGNPFIGHRKHTKVRGTLFDGGKPVASFKGLRTSMGGAFAGYKGSCSVLGRTVEVLGKDIAGWLAKPVDGAELGDL